MANNIDVKDAAAATKTVKTTDNAGVHTPHHNVDTMPALAAGSAIIGKVGIDQTTPGTTDSVTMKAGELHIGEVSGSSNVVTIALTVSTSPAYTAGDNIGGKMTLTGACRANSKAVTLLNITILDRANQKPTGHILIFDADPSSATLTDNAATVLSTDDLKVIARIPVTAADWATINSKGLCSLPNLGRVLLPASGTTLYATYTTDSTPTFAATTDVQIKFGFVARD